MSAATTAEIFSIELFQEDEIRQYLSKHEVTIGNLSGGKHTSSSILAELHSIYDLDDLAKRPILLKLIVHTLPRFVRNSRNKFTLHFGNHEVELNELTPTALYWSYIDFEMRREYQKAQVLWIVERQDKLRFLQLLAYQMYIKSKLEISRNELEDAIGNALPLGGHSLESVATDIRTCSFLVRGGDDSFRFTHKSFMEYFAALHMLESTLSSPDQEQMNFLAGMLSIDFLSDEVMYFMGDLIATFYAPIVRVLHELSAKLDDTGQSSGHCRSNCLNILNYARQPNALLRRIEVEKIQYLRNTIRNLRLERVSTQSLLMAKSDIAHLALFHCTSRTMLIKNCTVSELSLERCDLKAVQIIGSTLSLRARHSSLCQLSFQASKCLNSRFSECSLVIGRSTDSSLRQTMFERTLVCAADGEHLSACDMNGVIFRECVFLQVSFGNDLYRGARFESCIFIGCYLPAGDSLKTLTGSKGFFVGRKGRSKAMPAVMLGDVPQYWSIDEASFLHRNHKNQLSAIGNNTTERKIYLRNCSWTEKLAIEFPYHEAVPCPISLEEVRVRIKNKVDRV
jgi:uncharacterized protein YjbI with pentapeptide repeats